MDKIIKRRLNFSFDRELNQKRRVFFILLVMKNFILYSLFLTFFIRFSIALECHKCDSNDIKCVEGPISGKTEQCEDDIKMCGTWIGIYRLI